MWRQLLFWAMVGPRHFQRFLLLWLVLIGFFFYAFVHEAFEGVTQRTLRPRPPMAVANR
jgi:hypothetical protein